MRTYLIAMLAATIATAAAEVSAETAQEMMGNCKPIAEARVEADTISYVQDHDSGMCWGAFGVIQDMLIWRAERGTGRLLRVCAPADGRRGQLIGVFVEYARRNPARWHEPFGRMAVDALREAFPCK